MMDQQEFNYEYTKLTPDDPMIHQLTRLGCVFAPLVIIAIVAFMMLVID